MSRSRSQRSARWATLLLFSAAALALDAQAAVGDWPMARHDPGASGRSAVSGSLSLPSEAWSLRVGGGLGVRSFFVGDVDGFPGSEWLSVQDGRVLLSDRAGRVIWDSPRLGVDVLVGVADLGGDGVPEVIASRAAATSSLRVLDGRSGALLWTLPPLPAGARTLRQDTVRLADLDGDGRPEILVKPWGPSSLWAYRHDPIREVAQLWRYDYVGYGNYNPPVVADLDGDGRAEVAFLAQRDLIVLSGEDGGEELRLEDILSNHSFDHLEAADLDRDGVPELLIIGRQSYSRSVTVVDVAAARVRWRRDWMPAADTGLLSPVRPLGDVDGDGRPELVFAVFNDTDLELDETATPGDHDGVNAPGIWTLLVLDAATGRTEASLPGWSPEALVDLDGDGQAEILAREAGPVASGPARLATLGRFVLEAGALRRTWQLAGARLVEGRDEQRSASLHDINTARPLVGVPAAQPGTGALVLLRDANGDGEEDRLERYAPAQGGLVVEASFDLPAHLQLAGLASAPGDGGEGPLGLIVARSDGWVEERAADFSALGRLAVGGAAAPPIAARLAGEQRARIFYTESGGWLVSASANAQSVALPPQERWRAFLGLPGSLSVGPLLGGLELQVVALARDAVGVYSVLALDAASGEPVWSRTLDDWQIVLAPLVAPVGPNGALGVVLRGLVNGRSADQDLRILALDGATGATLWDRPASQNSAWAEPLPAADLDGDGRAEVVHVDAGEFETLAGSDGRSLSRVACRWCKRPQLADIDGDGQPELLLHEGAQVCAWEGGPQWQRRWCGDKAYSDEGVLSASALVQGAAPAGGALAMPGADGRVALFAGGAAPRASRWLLGGQVLDAAPLGGFALSDLSAVDLDPQAGDELLAVGEDGWLYLLDGADGALRWSHFLGVATGEPVVADLGSGLPSLLLAGSDGRLRLLRDATLPAPARVREVGIGEDGAALAAGPDIDEWGLLDRLAAAWDPVAEAGSYRVVLVSANGTVLSEAVVPSGEQSWLFEGLRLLPGAYYQVRVAALAATGLSAEASSDGVRIVDSEPPAIVDLRTEPPVFDPADGALRVLASLQDESGLASVELSIAGAAGEVFAVQRELWGTDLALDESWDGRDPRQQQVPDGPYLAVVVLSDRAGHLARGSVEFVVSTGLPTGPIIDFPVEGQEVDPWAGLRGRAEPGLAVRVMEGELSLCAGIASAAGLWSCAPAEPLAEGEHVVQALATDWSGRDSLPSALRTFWVARELPPGDLGPDLGPGDPDLGGGDPDLGGGDPDLGGWDSGLADLGAPLDLGPAGDSGVLPDDLGPSDPDQGAETPDLGVGGDTGSTGADLGPGDPADLGVGAPDGSSLDLGAGQCAPDCPDCASDDGCGCTTSPADLRALRLGLGRLLLRLR